ncbi:DUF4189 domain-containing protein [Streptomyces sp. NPDC044780]|uniref:DUF4189 domain-containing protein n=1 Tax=unclassified Streptomyces TaxID=2593676 RepID=UPI0033C1E31A
MTPPSASVVEHGTLSLGPQLGQGGQGTVYKVLNKRINEADGGGWEVVYKEYGAAVLPDLDATALTASVALLGELSAADGQWLCERTAWPAAVVRRQGEIRGFLMRAVPDRFWFTLRSLAGTNGGTQRLANLEYLLNDDNYVAGIGLTISDRHRLLILADLAQVLDRLHRIGVSVGDLSPKNLLFTTDPQPEVFLIDCDAARLRGRTVLPQAETPDWQVPAGEVKATRASDVYKLALLAIRIFARDQTTTDPAALAAIDPALGDLARASLDPDPARRPTPAQWAERLAAARNKTSTSPAQATAPGGPTPLVTRLVRPGAGGGGGSGGGGPAGNPFTTGAGTTGPRVKPSAMAGTIAAAVAVILVLVLANTHGSSDDDSSAGAPLTSSSSPSYPDYTSDPTDTETDYYTPDPDETTADDDSYDSDYDDTPEPDPTTEAPDPDPTTEAPDPVTEAPEPPPRPDYYGAIAVAHDGSMGKAWDYSSQSAAQSAALSRCSGSGCKVLVTFVNSCGAIAYNDSTNQYWGGQGATATEAENSAISHAGGGRWLTYVCTTRY